MASYAAAVAISRAELNFSMCDDCGFVFNQAFDLSPLHYSEEYDNAQSCSPYFDAYLDELVRDMVERQGVRNCTIVEVGCGKGNFLRKLVNYPQANTAGYGFDPSYVGPKEGMGGRLQFRTCNYDHPNKQGRFIPGTGHPIVAPKDLPERNVTSAVLMNRNYRDEILGIIEALDLKVHLIDWSV